jgi:hypothetical protein
MKKSLNLSIPQTRSSSYEKDPQAKLRPEKNLILMFYTQERMMNARSPAQNLKALKGG